MRHRARDTAGPTPTRVPDPPRLHIGSGRARLEGWLNLDVQDLPGVDLVIDVTTGLPFHGVEAVYAEHFLEHLELDRALDFLLDVHRCLDDSGALRLSTPNLDWVWETHYSSRTEDPSAKRIQGLRLNRAFHGWRHRFLWNRELLAAAVTACGFEDLAWCGWGESPRVIFRGIERHETYEDRPDLPHVIIVEARRGEARPAALAALRRLVETEFLAFRND